MSEKNYFAELAAIDVGKHVEKKGKFSYLSWPWAVKTLCETCPDATWEVKRFDGKPYMVNDCGFFVEVSVTVNGVTRSQIHPVLDNNNRPIPQPSSFQINTSIQRCLVKAIGLHGLGLYIYAGEDLPDAVQEAPQTITAEQADELTKELKQTDIKIEDFLTRAGVSSIDAIPARKFNGAMQWIKTQANKQVA